MLSRGLHGHIDFLGTGAVSLKEEVGDWRVTLCFRINSMQQKYTPTILANTQVSFVVLSDVWLDHPRTIPALRRLFEGYVEAAEFRPMAFVLCGNFCQRGWEGEGGLKRYTSGCVRSKPRTVLTMAKTVSTL